MSISATNIKQIGEQLPPISEVLEEENNRYAIELGRRILTAANYYDALGISLKSTADEIRDAFRRTVSLFHPDLYKGPEAAAITRKLIEIRDTLTNPAQKAIYDSRLGVPAAPTVQVAVGQPVVYCTECQSRGRGLVMMQYEKTLGPYKSTGRSYDIYVCPDPTCKKERVGNFFRGIFLGFGK